MGHGDVTFVIFNVTYIVSKREVIMCDLQPMVWVKDID